jgi:molybdopterin synthase catalytic subunit
MTPRILVQTADFDVGEETERLARGADDVGAVATFVGYCRSEGGKLAALEIEHYAGMAEAEIARVASEAQARWPINALTIIHRFGTIDAGGRIVFVGIASRHRQAAFAACEMLMDYMKSQAPFWKRVTLADGAKAEWVAAAATDDEALKRWEPDKK